MGILDGKCAIKTADGSRSDKKSQDTVDWEREKWTKGSPALGRRWMWSEQNNAIFSHEKSGANEKETQNNRESLRISKHLDARRI